MAQKVSKWTCRLCGKAFLPKVSWQVMCSKRCRMIEWGLRQPEAKRYLKEAA